MTVKKQPLRTCIACREQKDKREFIKLLRTVDGIMIDRTGKMDGRGAYICKKDECFKKAVKSKAIGRAFKIQPSEELLKELEDEIGQ